jgi:DNA-directed RNA polymerase subunit RPC12/RpoP
MATSIINYKCPNCRQDNLTKVDRMIRCTCGWWMLVDDEENSSLQSYEFATVAAS